MVVERFCQWNSAEKKVPIRELGATAAAYAF